MDDTPLEKLIANICDTSDLSDAEVCEELAADGVDVDAAKARTMAKVDALLAERAVRLAIAAVKANPLSEVSPRWASFDEYTCAFIRNPHGGHVAQFRTNTERDYALAAVKAAPVLVAEVERLTAQLAAARAAVAELPMDGHRIDCPALDPDEEDRRCECSMMATIEEARRAVGLEGGK